MLLGIAGKDAQQFTAPGGADQEHASIFCDVKQHECAREAGDDALLAIKRRGVEGAIGARPACGEPDLFSIGSPRQTLNREPLAGKKLFVAREIDDRKRAAVIALLRMICECDEVTLGRDARMSDPAAGLIERFPNGKLEAIPPAHIADHGEIAAVG